MGGTVKAAIDILILETDPGETVALVEEMQRHQLDVGALTVRPTSEALSAMKFQTPDVVLASAPQPDHWLFEFLESLQASRNPVPVIVITSRFDPGQLVELLECGAAAHLRRQNLGELTALIQFALENPISAFSPDEIEIIRETTPAVETSRLTRSTCGAPTLRRICERCSRIANSSGEWERLGVFLRRNQNVTVALGLCPDCARSAHAEPQLPPIAGF